MQKEENGDYQEEWCGRGHFGTKTKNSLAPNFTSQQPRAVPPRQPRQNKTPVPLYGDHGNDLENVDYDCIKVMVSTCSVIIIRCCGSFEGDWRVLDPGA